MDKPQRRSSGSSSSPSPFRRRRRIICVTLVVAVLLFCFNVPWQLPSALTDAGVVPTGISRANVVSLVTPKSNEIYGLLHFVVNRDEVLLSSPTELDPAKPIAMNVYGNEKEDWKKNEEVLNKEYPVVVFSKARVLPALNPLTADILARFRHTARQFFDSRGTRSITLMHACRYSRKAKELLTTYDLSPKPKFIQVDLRGMFRPLQRNWDSHIPSRRHRLD
jgi:hypothetical protein